MISIITSCIGRELYLQRLLHSILVAGGYDKVEFEHLIVFQGSPPSSKMRDYIQSLPFANSIQIGTTSKIEPVGAVLMSAVKEVRYPIIFKIDDDCTLLSQDFLLRAYELCLKMPKGVIYPYIVDGETSPEGGKIELRQSVFLEKSNIYMTVGAPTYISGKYLLPTEFAKKLLFEGQRDPQVVKIATLVHHLPIFQAMNGLVIEIQEGISGQHYRKTIKPIDGQQLC